MKRTRRTIKRARLILMAVLILGVLSVGVRPQPASAIQGPPIPVSSCGANLDVPGNYILTTNLNCAGTAITITANDVNFNLRGFTISGDGTGIGIFVGFVLDVHIHGGTVTGFGVGMRISNLQDPQPDFDLHVNGMTITGNGTGMQLSQAQANHINGNTITGNQGVGVQVIGGVANQFNSNVVTDNGGGGFDLSALSFNVLNVISSNDISRNGDFGVRLSRNNFFNTVRGNTVNENSVGIHILSGNDPNTIQSNTALGNTIFDLQDDNPNCGSNTWRSNIFGTANQGCIQ